MAVVWIFAILRKKKTTKKKEKLCSEPIWVQCMEDQMRDWKVFGGLLEGYTFWVSGRKDRGGGGETGNRLVCILAIVVCSRQACCKRRLRLLFERGVVGITKGDGGMVPGRSWCYDEGSLGSSHLAGVLVAEEQLCRRFHIPGFWRQGRYYCIL